ncbi:hypothetical protein WR25_23417 [Diploscapter pachys]|uniref:Uncharacterized protein n=1 Tax=Diploscapter pachys TaxID=2018661 RepID=A0A2A2JM63_9BILA|nr:hypothetical protein WR25_23417 [Diploscapter pachys]
MSSSTFNLFSFIAFAVVVGTVIVEAFEKHCSTGKVESVPTETESGTPLSFDLVMPPPLPRGSAFAQMDLPLGADHKTSESSSGPAPAPAAGTRLTAAIIASCTPDCTAAHCTDECKCAHTHPKVHAMCNPPATAQLAETCQKWYAKCTMFNPVSYY